MDGTMSLRSALYYPHTIVNNVEIVKTALLTWDHLEFIVPWDDFPLPYKSREIARAMEIIGKPRLPSEEDKTETHRRIVSLLESRAIPDFYVVGDSTDDDVTQIYIQKFHHETWVALRERRLAGDLSPRRDYTTLAPVGRTIMAILADCCAGTKLARITDHGDTYALLVAPMANQEILGMVESSHEKLIAIGLETANLADLSLTEAIELREREEKDPSGTLRELRHSYLRSIDKYLSCITSIKTSRNDSEEVLRQFKDDLRVDLNNLKREMQHSKIDGIFSKEVLVTAIASVGTVGSWLLGTPVELSGVISAAGTPAAIGGSIAVTNRFMASRHAVMRRHPTAYLYSQSQ